MKEEKKDSVKIVAVDLQAMAPLPGVIQIQVIMPASFIFIKAK